MPEKWNPPSAHGQEVDQMTSFAPGNLSPADPEDVGRVLPHDGTPTGQPGAKRQARKPSAVGQTRIVVLHEQKPAIAGIRPTGVRAPSVADTVATSASARGFDGSVRVRSSAVSGVTHPVTAD